MDFIWVAVGGACGAVCRYGVGILLVDRVASRLPFATLLVNVSGGLAIGLLAVALTERLVADPAWRLLLAVGFVGGYTTFSSYTFETVALVEAGRWHSAAAYVISSNGLGLLATWNGMLIARAIAR